MCESVFLSEYEYTYVYESLYICTQAYIYVYINDNIYISINNVDRHICKSRVHNTCERACISMLG